jgi:apolipoprotein D and lipocalin family protein
MFKALTATCILSLNAASAVSYEDVVHLRNSGNTTSKVGKTTTVDELIIDSFTGLWYEIYTRSPFESNTGQCVTALYTSNDDGTIGVHNYGTEGVGGEVDTIDGYAYVKDESDPGKLKLHLDGASPFDVDYWVLDLGPMSNDLYDYAIVSDRFTSILYVLARDPVTFHEKYGADVQAYIEDLGFTGRKAYREVVQGGECVYESALRADHIAGKDSLNLGVDTVDTLDVESYLGLWYQVYADSLVYSTIEPDAQCVTALYGLRDDGKISVHNYQTTGSPDSGIDTIDGYAYIPNEEEPGKLKVHFDVNSGDAPYWVLSLGPKNADGLYDYSIVSDPFKAYLFVLTRDVDTFKSKYEDDVLKELEDLGFNKKYNSPIATYHGADCVYE